MALIQIHALINARAAIWLHYLAEQKRLTMKSYLNQVLLKHLEQTPGVDLSQSPYSEPKGVSNGKEGCE
jgi:hypothetical protein